MTHDAALARTDVVHTPASEIAELMEWRRDEAAEQMISVTSRIEEVEAAWRSLEAFGVDSPGQNYDFLRLWVKTHKIAEADQRYVTVSLGDQPVLVLPVWRHRARGVRIWSWFTGPHVGCNGPLVHPHLFGALDEAGKARLWRAATAALDGADLIYLRSIADGTPARELAATAGQLLPVETLYRADFSSWDEANTTQRSKSRRKHDRQQGERLEALGEVAFDVIEPGAHAQQVLDIMFDQRAARFKQMGVTDSFAPADVRCFYDGTARLANHVPLRLHVLRLNGEIVAVRYNIALGDKLFCLISSMSEDPAIQGGSPGKQCLLRVMQSVFDQGYRTFDMGAGFTDEKRHWCNTQLGLSHYYLPLNPYGALAAKVHSSLQAFRRDIKQNEKLRGWVKSVRAKLGGGGKKDVAPKGEE